MISLGVTLTMVLHEEITAYEVTQRMLNQWEADIQKQMKSSIRWYKKRQDGNCRIESYWKDFYKWFVKEDTKTHCVISMLRAIEQLLQNLPTLQRDKMQSMYSSLCAEADTIMI